MQPFPAEPAETTYTFHITPSTPEARERIADGAEKPELLCGTLAQGRDLARLLDASIDLLDGRGLLAVHVKPDGDYSRIGEPDCPVETRPIAHPILMVNAASAADDRLSELGRRVVRSHIHNMPAPSTHDKLIHAEAEAARHLGNYNAAHERGAVAAAEKHLARAQRWLDKANDLRGRGSA